MFFHKHHIVIIKSDAQGQSRKFRFRLWPLLILAFVFVGLLASTLWLGAQYIQHRHIDAQLQLSQEKVEDQNAQLFSLRQEIQDLTQNFRRIERFDAKIRQMLDLNADLGSVESDNEDITSTPLPLHKPSLMARRMQSFLSQLGNDMELEEVNQQEVLKALRLKEKSLSTSPSIWPVRGRINSSFGYRRAPFGGHRSFHKGIDIKGAMGAPILASAAGVVKSAGYDGAYGIVVVIDHGGGVVTKYAHMQIASVKAGQRVKRGETVGRVGMTGRTTGPHLHYEVVVGGVPRDPIKYMLD